jgi:hypothetical protein
MFDSIGNTISAAKAKLVEASATAFLNREIGDFGKVTALNLDPKSRTASLTVELKGEPSPVEVSISSYEIILRDGQPNLCVKEARTNREWLTIALKKYLEGKLIRLPSSVAPFLQ